MEDLAVQVDREETEMDKITTEFAEFICDNVCKYPVIVHDQELLENCCADCPMGQYICDILNTYNRINDFDKTQSAKMLVIISELKERLKNSGVLNLDLTKE